MSHLSQMLSPVQGFWKELFLRVEDTQLVVEQRDERTQGALCKCVTETHSRWRDSFTWPAGSRFDAQTKTIRGRRRGDGDRETTPEAKFTLQDFQCRRITVHAAQLVVLCGSCYMTGRRRGGTTRFWPGRRSYTGNDTAHMRCKQQFPPVTSLWMSFPRGGVPRLFKCRGNPCHINRCVTGLDSGSCCAACTLIGWRSSQDAFRTFSMLHIEEEEMRTHREASLLTHRSSSDSPAEPLPICLGFVGGVH